ncbi:enoyl-CoA hydratase/isomerase family protein [Thalassovita taeanensis]|uniref:Enoyl-CoA hydratase/carnithine racemase n=1 Tax=Thalassovita taeanensis TaxID=657014 RepID=A0A1H9H916_9RHOB|nr:enoyl-CoA hydratase-related protein [Thalassovita taeanensis]SEQ58822.1 Enoyl-CoA hydratase/carnithine racemase [Thalassovita taeanensis]
MKPTQDTSAPDYVRTERHGATLVITLSDPARRNPINAKVASGLQDAFAQQECDETIRAVVLTGDGGNFSSGGDISAMEATRGTKRLQFTNSKKTTGQIIGASVPVIAAVEGWAAGAGFSIAMLADTVIASRKARFVASFPKVGLVPDYGLLETLPQRVGLGRAKQILLYADPIDAETGYAIGMVDELTDPGAALEAALAKADRLSSIAPRAIRGIKEYYACNINRVLDFERMMQPELLLSDDAAEGRAAFREKRPPSFTDR